jgi:membrane protease YdiL (CAAX protease family)
MTFGIYSDFLIVNELSAGIGLVVLFGFAILLGLGKLIELFMYNDSSKEKMRQHDVVSTLLNKKGFTLLLVFLILTMVMEELIFRYYLIGLLLNELLVGSFSAIVISSIIFSVYHFHIWFRFKDFRILVSYLVISFLLGIYNGVVLLTLGIFPCIILHTLLVFILYYNLYRKLSK